MRPPDTAPTMAEEYRRIIASTRPALPEEEAHAEPLPKVEAHAAPRKQPEYNPETLSSFMEHRKPPAKRAAPDENKRMSMASALLHAPAYIREMATEIRDTRLTYDVKEMFEEAVVIAVQRDPSYGECASLLDLIPRTRLSKRKNDIENYIYSHRPMEKLLQSYPGLSGLADECSRDQQLHDVVSPMAGNLNGQNIKELKLLQEAFKLVPKDLVPDFYVALKGIPRDPYGANHRNFLSRVVGASPADRADVITNYRISDRQLEISQTSSGTP